MSATDQAMFGCDRVAMMTELAKPIADHGLAMVLTSMLSDVQNMIACGRTESARQAINRVKHILGQQLPKVYATPADVAVDAEVSVLRNLHSETTKGQWHALPGRSRAICGTVVPGGYTGVDVLRGSGRNAREGKRNTEFSARLHNAALPLLDSAELVQHVLTKQETLPRDQRDSYIVDRAQAALSALKQSQL
jgi:hypothetical protein